LALQALNKHTEAIAYFDKAIKVFPAPSYYYGKGYSQYMLEKYADSVVNFSKAIDVYPKNLSANADYYYYRALSYRSLGNFDLSLKDMKKVIELRPLDIDKLAGTVKDSKYANEYLGMELTLPKEWATTTVDLEKLIEQYTGQGDVQINETYLPLILSKYPVGSTVGSNPNLLLMLENVAAYPTLKTGADYLPYVLKEMSQQRSYKYDQTPEKITLSSVSFDTINCETEQNGATVYQKLYATVYRGYALCFALTYTDKAELTELENILKTINFVK
jgi:tetratricopeptide (TPR) repeat protein